MLDYKSIKTLNFLNHKLKNMRRMRRETTRSYMLERAILATKYHINICANVRKNKSIGK